MSVDNLTNTAVERLLPEVAEYKFNVLQEIARPSGAAQRFELALRINGTVDLTTLCMGKLCDKKAD